MSLCMTCGACCASFRVSFYWAEADDGGGTVPAALTEPLDPWRRCMVGTWSDAPRCAALQGEVGQQVGCAVYAQRPSVCRQLEEGSAQCQKARARWRLAEPEPA